MKYDAWLFIALLVVIVVTIVSMFVHHADAAVMDHGSGLTVEQMADIRGSLCD